jgi:predicted negative regulator of RcsB-dependent stress response
MTSHKQHEKELKRPDRFQDIGTHLINYVVNNMGRVALMLSPVILIAVVGYGVYGWKNLQASKRRAELAKIFTMQMAEQEDVSKKTESMQKEIESLRNTKGEPEKNAATKPGDKPDDTKAKATQPSAESLLKIAEIEAKIKNLKPDNGPSAQKFKEYYESNKSSAEGWTAAMSYASYLLKHNKLDEAKTIAGEVVKASISHKFFQMQSRFMMAGILIDQNQLDEALKEADTLMGIAGEEAKSMVMMLKSEILYFKKDYATARPILKEIIEKHGSTREAQLARSLLAEIGPA